MGIIEEFFRGFLWAIAYAGLKIMDMIYGLVLKIGSLSFLSLDSVWSWWSYMIMYISLIVIVKVIISSIKILFDEEKLMQYDLFKRILKIFVVVMVVGLSPLFLKGASEIGSVFVQNVSLIAGVSEKDAEPSTIVINSTANIDTDVGFYDEDGSYVENPIVKYKLNDIDINDYAEGTDEYKFFPKLSDLFVVIVIGLVTSVLMVLIAIQIAQRLFEVVLLVLVSPFPISSLIDDGDDSFGVWTKMILAVYLNNFFQILMLIIVMNLNASEMVLSQPFLVQIVLLISGFMFLLQGVPQIARLIGGDTSSAGTLQQLSSLKMATAAAGGAAMAGVGVAAAGIGKFGGALKTVGVASLGKKLGGVGAAKMPGGGGGGGGAAGNNNFQSGMSGVGGDSGGGGGSDNGAANYGMPNSDNTQQSQQTAQQGYSTAGSWAAQKADKAYAATGAKGLFARAAVNTASHSYAKATTRLQNSKVLNKVKGTFGRPEGPIERG